MLRPTLQAANHPLLVRVHYTDAMLPSLAKRLAVCVSPKPGLGPMRSPAFARCKARPRWSDGDSPAAWWWADAQRRLLDACRTLGRNAHRAGCHQRTTHSVTLMRLQPYIRSWDGPTGTGPPWAWRWATVGMALAPSQAERTAAKPTVGDRRPSVRAGGPKRRRRRSARGAAARPRRPADPQRASGNAATAGRTGGRKRGC